MRRKVPSRTTLPDFDVTMRQIWAIFGVAFDRLTRRGIEDPSERLERVRDVMLAALNDPKLRPPKRERAPTIDQ